MPLVRWNPWREMDTFNRRLNDIFDESLIPTSLREFTNFPAVPAVELTETKHAIHLKLEVPGIEAKDLDVKVTEDTVSISGERKSEKHQEDQDSVVTHSEFRYGKFQRLFSLPARVENTQVKAEYKDGILNLMLPKTESEKNKIVQVDIVNR